MFVAGTDAGTVTSAAARYVRSEVLVLDVYARVEMNSDPVCMLVDYGDEDSTICISRTECNRLHVVTNALLLSGCVPGVCGFCA